MSEIFFRFTPAPFGGDNTAASRRNQPVVAGAPQRSPIVSEVGLGHRPAAMGIEVWRTRASEVGGMRDRF
jgi:hypothetical protein